METLILGWYILTKTGSAPHASPHSPRDIKESSSCGAIPERILGAAPLTDLCEVAERFLALG
jgi:hypothetical protein